MLNNLHAIEIYRDSKFLLVAIKSVNLQRYKMGALHHLSAEMKPTALVVCSHEVVYALDMEAKPTSLDFLKQNVPGLAGILETFS